MKKNRNGSALIFAVIVSIILMLIAIGLFIVVNYNIHSTASTIKKCRLLYAAQSGINYGVVWLKHIPYKEFNGESPQSLSKSLSIDGSQVSLSAMFNTNIRKWTIKSQALLDGETCNITLDNIFGETPLRYTSFSADPSVEDFYVLDKDQIWIGDVYYNSNIRLAYNKNGNPQTAAFYGTVDCTNSFKSRISGQMNQSLANQSDYGSYSLGIDLAAEENYSGLTTSDINNVLNNTFQNYRSGVQTQPVNLISEDWDKLTAGNTTHKIQGNAEINFEYRNSFSHAGISYPTGYYAMIKNNNIVTYLPQNDNNQTNQKNVIAVDGIASVKGVLNNDFTIVTKNNDIQITGDLYSVGYKDYINRSNNEFGNYAINDSTHPANTIQKIRDGHFNIGLIAGAESIADKPENALFSGLANNRIYTPNGSGANIVIMRGNGVDAVDTDKNGVVLISAGMFAPNGKLVSQDEGLNWKNKVLAVIYGSFLGFGEGVTGSYDTGISPCYIGSSFFEHGINPPGYKSSTERNQLTGNYMNKLGSSDWSISWGKSKK